MITFPLMFRHVASFIYTNYKGETERRHARFYTVRYGTSEWHTEPQWLLLAFDLDKRQDREFAMKDMTDVTLLDIEEGLV
jgi:predicted DNA-binding transcriptional regulator YafY